MFLSSQYKGSILKASEISGYLVEGNGIRYFFLPHYIFLRHLTFHMESALLAIILKSDEDNLNFFKG